MAYARHQFMLSQPQDDGKPLIDHLRAVQAKTGKVDELIAEAPDLPDGLAPLWRDFLELHDSRGSNGWGPSRITYADLRAYSDMTGTTLEAWEIEALRKADSVWLSEYAPKPKEAK